MVKFDPELKVRRAASPLTPDLRAVNPVTSARDALPSHHEPVEKADETRPVPSDARQKEAEKEGGKFDKKVDKDWTHAYADDLRADVYTEVNSSPKADVHQREWRKIMNGDPVEINPSVGSGLKCMTIDEWSCRWKQNDRFPECLACGSESTKEHHFMQTWCRSKKAFESETLCLDCHMFSWRSYSDPDFLTPEEYDKIRWENMVNDKAAGRPVVPDADKRPSLEELGIPTGNDK